MKLTRLLKTLSLFALILLVVEMSIPGGDARTALAQTEQLVKINEVMFNPFGNDTGIEWLELYNAGIGPENLDGWTISNRDGTTATTLPSWDLPSDSYLIVFFGAGSSIDDFSDGYGLFCTGNNLEVFNNLEDEVGLYSGSPGPTTIADFISWSSDQDYNPGQAHHYAVTARIWSSGEYFDIGFATGKTVLAGESIGRDKNSTDTDQPQDWDRHGGVDAYYSTLGAENSGPLSSIDDGIRATQMAINQLLMNFGHRITYGSHTNLEELQSDNDTYVKAEHYFETILGDSEKTFQGVGEYHWSRISSSDWKEEIDFLLSAPDLKESYSLNYTLEWTENSPTQLSIRQNIYGVHSFEVFETEGVSSDPDRPTRIITETYSAKPTITISQTGPNSYCAEGSQEINDFGINWNLSFVKEELIVSDNQVESWLDLTMTSDVEEDTAISAHYNTTVIQKEPGSVEIRKIETVYSDYSLIRGNETFSLSEPGYSVIEKVGDGYSNIYWNILLANGAGESLDLGGSGYVETLAVGEELVYRGELVGNRDPTIYQFYIDGARQLEGIGEFIIGLSLNLAMAGAPTAYQFVSNAGDLALKGKQHYEWAKELERGELTVWKFLADIVGVRKIFQGDPDICGPYVNITEVGGGTFGKFGWKTVRFEAQDGSGLMSVCIQCEPAVENYCHTAETPKWDEYYDEASNKFERTIEFRNYDCVQHWIMSCYIWAVDRVSNSSKVFKPCRPEGANSLLIIVPPRICWCGDFEVQQPNSQRVFEQCDPPKDDSEQCGQTTKECEGNKLKTRDDKGNCVECLCLEDPWDPPKCVRGECGAECERNEDCSKGEVCDLDKCKCTNCGNKVWDQKLGEFCDQSAVPGPTGCDPGWVCIDCQSCMKGVITPSCGDGYWSGRPEEFCDQSAAPDPTGCDEGWDCIDCERCAKVIITPVFPNWYVFAAAAVAAGGLGYLIWRRLLKRA